MRAVSRTRTPEAIAVAPDRSTHSWMSEALRAAWALPDNAEIRLLVVSENATYVVELLDLPTMVIRVARPGYSDDATHLRSELCWSAALHREIGLRTPRSVPGADGDQIQTLCGPDGVAWLAVAFEFVSGSTLESQPRPQRFYPELGRITAEMHRHARGWEPPAHFRRFGWGLDALIGPEARWGRWERADLGGTEYDLLRRAESAAVDHVRAGLTTGPADFGLIHGDLRPSNVLADGVEVHVIDFDDCGHGYYLYDAAAALSFYEHLPEASDMLSAWCEGYRSVAPLSSADEALIGSLTMIRRLTMLGWSTTHDLGAIPAELRDEIVSGAVTVADRYLTDRAWLTS